MSIQIKILFYFFFLIVTVIFFNSCDVVDLILYKKEVSVIRQGEYSEVFDVYGTSFNVQNLITKEDLSERIEMPDEGGIRSVNIESVLIELTTGTDNISEEITLDIYAGTSESEIYNFVSKAVLILENTTFVNPGLISKPDLEGVGELFLRTISTADSIAIPSFNLGIQNNGPVNSFLDVDVKVTIKYAAEIYYCALVPGNSALPECSE